MSACPYPAALCEAEVLAGGGPTGEQERAPRVLPGRGFHWMLLQRHGQRPLAVYGRALLEAHNRCGLASTWSHVAIYETASGRFAVCIRHTPREAEAPSWADGWLCDTADAVRASIVAHDPLWSLALPRAAWESLPQAAWETLPRAAWNFAHENPPIDSTEATRFHAAWKGLLAAVFGRSTQQEHAA